MKLKHAAFALLCLTPFLLLSGASAAPPTIGGCGVLPADNVWNTPIDTLPVDPSSPLYVSTIGGGIGLKADFGAGLWDGGPIGIPYTTVSGAPTKYPATFDYADESDPGPYAVPLNAPIEGGSQSGGDRHAISIDTTSCVLYELYYAFPQTASWQAGSGAIYDLKSQTLRPAGWTSADAAGLPIFPGLVRYDEIAAGEIRHAIRFTVPKTRNTYIWPARHKASSLTGAQYPPMGERFRLRADFDISSYSATNQIILKALKKYGMILADNGSAWYMSGAPDERWNNSDLNKLKGVLGASFEAVNESSLMIDANSGQAKQPGGGSVSTATATPTRTSTATATKTATATPTKTSTPVGVATNTPVAATATLTSTATATPTKTSTATPTKTATATATNTSTATPTSTATATPTATPSPSPRASITSPAPGTKLGGSSVSFSWTPASGAFGYYLFAGSAPGSGSYGAVYTASLSASLVNLPADGSMIYVRLWSLAATGWLYTDYTYQAFN